MTTLYNDRWQQYAMADENLILLEMTVLYPKILQPTPHPDKWQPLMTVYTDRWQSNLYPHRWKPMLYPDRWLSTLYYDRWQPNLYPDRWQPYTLRVVSKHYILTVYSQPYNMKDDNPIFWQMITTHIPWQFTTLMPYKWQSTIYSNIWQPISDRRQPYIMTDGKPIHWYDNQAYNLTNNTIPWQVTSNHILWQLTINPIPW